MRKRNNRRSSHRRPHPTCSSTSSARHSRSPRPRPAGSRQMILIDDLRRSLDMEHVDPDTGEID